jgi:hypothetical protein
MHPSIDTLYVRRDPVNPWFTIDIGRSMIERNIAKHKENESNN